MFKEIDVEKIEREWKYNITINQFTVDHVTSSLEPVNSTSTGNSLVDAFFIELTKDQERCFDEPTTIIKRDTRRFLKYVSFVNTFLVRLMATVPLSAFRSVTELEKEELKETPINDEGVANPKADIDQS